MIFSALCLSNKLYVLIHKNITISNNNNFCDPPTLVFFGRILGHRCDRNTDIMDLV